MVVPTGVVVCGRADGPHPPIERFRLEQFNRRIRDDAPYRWTGLSIGRRRSRIARPSVRTGFRVWDLGGPLLVFGRIPSIKSLWLTQR